MKKTVFLVFLFAGYFAFSQKCGDYYYLQNNKTIEITIKNKKGKESGKLVYNISNVSKKGIAISSTINSEMFDKNGKSISKANNNVQCENGELMMDMKMFIPSAQQEQMGNVSATADNVYLEYPANPKPGDVLKDASFSMDFKTQAGMNGRIVVDITNRTIAGKESVTTPAGTWDCIKITYHSKINFKILIGMNINSDVTEWYATGFGVIKTDSNGGTTEVTSIK